MPGTRGLNSGDFLIAPSDQLFHLELARIPTTRLLARFAELQRSEVSRECGQPRSPGNVTSVYAVTRPFEVQKFDKAELASAARARGRTLKSLGQFSPDWIALRQLCLCRDPL